MLMIMLLLMLTHSDSDTQNHHNVMRMCTVGNVKRYIIACTVNSEHTMGNIINRVIALRCSRRLVYRRSLFIIFFLLPVTDIISFNVPQY